METQFIVLINIFCLKPTKAKPKPSFPTSTREETEFGDCDPNDSDEFLALPGGFSSYPAMKDEHSSFL